MWKQVIEEGQVIWVNESVGNVIKTPGGKYVAAIPKIIKLGPFHTVEEAQQAAENQDSLQRVLDNYNLSLVGLADAIRG